MAGSLKILLNVVEEVETLNSESKYVVQVNLIAAETLTSTPIMWQAMIVGLEIIFGMKQNENLICNQDEKL